MSDVVYTGLSIYGKLISVVSAVFTVLLCAYIAGIGWYALHDPHTMEINGIIVNVVPGGTFDVKYSISGIVYTTRVFSVIKYNIGDTVVVYSNPENPKDIELDKIPSNKAYILFAASGVGVFLSALLVYFTFEYKEFAAFEGGLGVFNSIR